MRHPQRHRQLREESLLKDINYVNALRCHEFESRNPVSLIGCACISFEMYPKKNLSAFVGFFIQSCRVRGRALSGSVPNE